MTAESDALPIASILRPHWRAFREHRPVGAYLTIGQLDGDCKCGRGEWPCAELRDILDGESDSLSTEELAEALGLDLTTVTPPAEGRA